MVLLVVEQALEHGFYIILYVQCPYFYCLVWSWICIVFMNICMSFGKFLLFANLLVGLKIICYVYLSGIYTSSFLDGLYWHLNELTPFS